MTSRRRAEFRVVVFLTVLVLVAVAAGVIVIRRNGDQGGHTAGGTTTTRAPKEAAISTTTTVARTTTTTSTTLPTTTTTLVPANPGSGFYQGAGFSIDYPMGWVVVNLPEGGGVLDNTFEPPGVSHGWLIRVDEDPHYQGTAAAAAAPVIAALNGDPTYRLVSVSPTIFANRLALRWEFEDFDQGVAVHKVDTFFVGGGVGWALLVQVPENVWEQERSVMHGYQETFSLLAPAPTTTTTTTPTGTTSTSTTSTTLTAPSTTPNTSPVARPHGPGGGGPENWRLSHDWWVSKRLVP